MKLDFLNDQYNPINKHDRSEGVPDLSYNLDFIEPFNIVMMDEKNP